MISAVVFDIDDTLYPELEYVRSGFGVVAEWLETTCELDREETFAQLSWLFDEGHRQDTFDAWLGNRSDLAVSVKTLVQVFRQHEPRLDLYPNVKELLDRLGRRFKLGLVSDGSVEVQRKKVKALGLDRMVDAIVLSDELGRDAWKPSTQPFLEIVQRLRSVPEDTVYVGENALKDFVGARAIGMMTVRVLSPPGFYTAEAPPSKNHEADACIESLDELESLLEKWNGISAQH